MENIEQKRYNPETYDLLTSKQYLENVRVAREIYKKDLLNRFKQAMSDASCDGLKKFMFIYFRDVDDNVRPDYDIFIEYTRNREIIEDIISRLSEDEFDVDFGEDDYDDPNFVSLKCSDCSSQSMRYVHEAYVEVSVKEPEVVEGSGVESGDEKEKIE